MDVRRLDADILKHIVEDVRDEVAVVVARRAKASGSLVASDRLDARLVAIVVTPSHPVRVARRAVLLRRLRGGTHRVPRLDLALVPSPVREDHDVVVVLASRDKSAERFLIKLCLIVAVEVEDEHHRRVLVVRRRDVDAVRPTRRAVRVRGLLGEVGGGR